MNDKENFISVLVDCNGYSREEAEEVADEFGNNLVGWIESRGGGVIEIAECVEFLGIK